eukprot:6476105-Amphidinium_carterae.1
MLHYSRDEQAVPLRSLWEVLSAVAKGSFDPDASRSGQFTGVPAAASSSGFTDSGHDLLASGSVPISGAKAHRVSGSDPASDDLLLSGASSDTSSVPSSCCEASDSRPRPSDETQLKSRRPAQTGVPLFLKHRKLRTIHKARRHDDLRLACGREITSSYSVIEEVLPGGPTCRICFGSSEVAPL